MDKNNNSTKIQLSIASLMFFSPFIKHLINSGKSDLDNKEKEFVESFISLGWINIIILILTAIVGISAYYNPSDFLINSYQILIGILILTIIGGSIAAIAEYPIISTTKNKNNLKESEKINLLLYYIPGYSIYLRYDQHKFDDPNVYLKESMFLWTLFGIFCFLPYNTPIFIISILIILRIATLISGIDFVSKKWSEKISKLFYKNPEEIWAYITGFIAFLFQNEYSKNKLERIINTHKKEYQYIYDIKRSDIKIQYIIGFLLIILILWQIDLGNIPAMGMLGVALLFSRYLTMIFIWNRAPSLPIIHEIQRGISKLGKTFKLKK